jgi:hypothetical protein
MLSSIMSVQMQGVPDGAGGKCSRLMSGCLHGVTDVVVRVRPPVALSVIISTARRGRSVNVLR